MAVKCLSLKFLLCFYRPKLSQFCVENSVLKERRNVLKIEAYFCNFVFRFLS